MAQRRNLLIGIAAIVIILVIAFVVTTGPSATSGYSAGTGAIATPMLITDPPQVPNGTQSLVIAYSSVMAHVTGGTGSGWVNATGSGTVNLLSTVNTSKVIGYANISANSTVNLVRFNITSATITINGTSYNMSVPNGQLTVAVRSGSKISATTGVLVSITPVVATVYTNNSVKFILAPAARAAVVGNVSGSERTRLGASVNIGASDRAELDSAAPNITITSASVATSGNTTTLSVTVADNSNTSAVLRTLTVRGSLNTSVSAVAGVNASVAGNVNADLGGVDKAQLGSSENALADIGMRIRSYGSLTFLIASNGTIAMPSGEAEFEGGGYTLAPGSSATLNFSGVLGYNSGIYQVRPVSGSQYQIAVIGQEDSFASTSVTAS